MQERPECLKRNFTKSTKIPFNKKIVIILIIYITTVFLKKIKDFVLEQEIFTQNNVLCFFLVLFIFRVLIFFSC